MLLPAEGQHIKMYLISCKSLCLPLSRPRLCAAMSRQKNRSIFLLSFKYYYNLQNWLYDKISTHSISAIQAIDVQFLIFLLAGRRLALRRSASAARRWECRHAAMYTPSGVPLALTTNCKRYKILTELPKSSEKNFIHLHAYCNEYFHLF